MTRSRILAAVSIVLVFAIGAGGLDGCRPALPSSGEGRPGASAGARPQTPAPAPPPGSSEPGRTVVLVDDLGEALVLPRPAERVVSLSPNLTEIVYFLGAGDRLVGVTDFCDWPPEARSKPSIGGIVNPSLERVLAARPDVVLAARGNDIAFLRRLTKAGLSVFATDPQTLEDVLQLIVRIGRIVGREEVAAEKTRRLRRQVERLRAKAAGMHHRPRALVVVQLDPLFVAGAGTFVDDLLHAAGMENAAAGARPWAEWGAERVIASRPELVIVIREHGSPEADRTVLASIASRSPWRELQAVRSGQVYSVTDDYLTIPGPRLVKGLAELVDIHARYEQAAQLDSERSGGGRA